MPMSYDPTGQLLLTPEDPDAPDRARRLRELGIGDRPVPEFDAFARHLAMTTGAPYAMVNFIDGRRQFFAGLYADTDTDAPAGPDDADAPAAREPSGPGDGERAAGPAPNAPDATAPEATAPEATGADATAPDATGAAARPAERPGPKRPPRWRPGRELARDHGYCPHVVVRRKALVLEDVGDYPRFAGNPLVDATGVRSYLGAPLLDVSGMALGTVCVLDVRPRPWGRQGLGTIKELAAELTGRIQGRAPGAADRAAPGPAAPGR